MCEKSPDQIIALLATFGQSACCENAQGSKSQVLSSSAGLHLQARLICKTHGILAVDVKFMPQLWRNEWEKALGI